MQHMLHLIWAQQFYTDLVLYLQCYVLQKLVEFKDFARLLSDFPVLFKADLIFKDFSRRPSKIQVLFKPVGTLSIYIISMVARREIPGIIVSPFFSFFINLCMILSHRQSECT